MRQSFLEIKNLSVAVGEKPILKGVSLTIQKGETHVIMGPNGSGKSTLANVLMGNPRFEVLAGKVFFDGSDITEMSPEERSHKGLFMAFQYPREVAGVQLDRFLFMAYNNIQKAKSAQALSVFDFNQKLQNEMKQLRMNPEFSSRSINEGFSGGEKKKAEMLQLAVLEPKLAILDETDSGLDVDALKIVGEAVNRFKSSDRSVLLVTHYQRILQYVKPDYVHIMIGGTMVKSGGIELAEVLEKDGYKQFIK